PGGRAARGRPDRVARRQAGDRGRRPAPPAGRGAGGGGRADRGAPRHRAPGALDRAARVDGFQDVRSRLEPGLVARGRRLGPAAPAGGGVARAAARPPGRPPRAAPAPVPYAGPGCVGAVRLFPRGPRDAPPSTLGSERARVILGPAAGSVEGEATLVLRAP